MAVLDAFMNGRRVGTFIRAKDGTHSYQYDEAWLAESGSRPISLSMPLQRHPYCRGAEAYNFFDNLLPDSLTARRRIAARFHARTTLPFDLLSKVGSECVGAMQLLPEGTVPYAIHEIDCKELSEQDVARILTGYEDGAPLGMINGFDDFRITLAGAQEKTALLLHDGRWCLPRGSTPTTHILKLPIGRIESRSCSIDLSGSVENEFICMLVAREFGLNVPDCLIVRPDGVKALAVERFDRRLSSDRSWIMRLPQEDFCQG